MTDAEITGMTLNEDIVTVHFNIPGESISGRVRVLIEDLNQTTVLQKIKDSVAAQQNNHTIFTGVRDAVVGNTYTLPT